MLASRRLHLSAVLIVATIVLSLPLAGEEPGRAGTDVVVTAEGLAACASGSSSPACRQAALADALRRAVEKGVGTLVLGETSTKNYQLVRDTVRTSAEGFVRDYRILDERLENGIYRVRIEARVAPGTPEQSLRFVCKRLKEELNPTFRVSVNDVIVGASADLRIAEKVIENELAALGLSTAGRKKTSTGVAIRGQVFADPLGEAIEGTKVFSADAAASLSVTDLSSGIVLPSMNVSLRQPIVELSQDRANREAIETVCRLWIRRNIPLIAAALLDPGKPAPVELGPREENPLSPTDLGPRIPPSDEPPRTSATPEGPRLKLKPGVLDELARKLKASVTAKSEFASLPVDAAVARFQAIGISDPALVNDVLEDLSTALVKMEVFELVERSQLDKVLQELRIQNSGLIDSTTARKLGKLVGAKAVLVGSISDRKDCFVINARLINTESGRVRVAESIVLDKETELEPIVLHAGPRR